LRAIRLFCKILGTTQHSMLQNEASTFGSEIYRFK